MANSDVFYKEIGRRIYQARDKKGLTQEELASSVNLKRTSITNIEKGKQKLLVHTLFDIALTLEIEPEKLLPEIKKILDKDKYPETSRKWVESTINNMKMEK